MLEKSKKNEKPDLKNKLKDSEKEQKDVEMNHLQNIPLDHYKSANAKGSYEPDDEIDALLDSDSEDEDVDSIQQKRMDGKPEKRKRSADEEISSSKIQRVSGETKRPSKGDVLELMDRELTKLKMKTKLKRT